MNVIHPREVSRMVEAGGVAAAVESASGNIYVGVCVDTACTLGVCAERNAIFNMITNGENAIRRVIAVDRNGKAVPPCGACREFMTQLMPCLLYTSTMQGSSADPTLKLFLGLGAGLAIACSAVIQGKAGAAGADAMAETGKGFAQYITVVGLG